MSLGWQVRSGERGGVVGMCFKKFFGYGRFSAWYSCGEFGCAHRREYRERASSTALGSGVNPGHGPENPPTVSGPPSVSTAEERCYFGPPTILDSLG